MANNALYLLEILSKAMEEDKIKISRLSNWDVDFLQSMSLNYDDYKQGNKKLSEKQIDQIYRIYDEQLGGHEDYELDIPS